MNYKITNTSEEDFTGEFDGQKITIPAGASATVSEGWAQHVFGVGLSAAERLRRAIKQGFVHDSGQMAEGLAFFAKFVCEPIADPVGSVEPAPQPAVGGGGGPPPPPPGGGGGSTGGQ